VAGNTPFHRDSATLTVGDRVGGATLAHPQHQGGGGTVPAPPEPVRGAARVAALLIGLGRLYPGVELRVVSVAGVPGVLLLGGDTLVGVTSVEVVAGRLTELNYVVNPAKLRTVPWTVDDGGATLWYRDVGNVTAMKTPRPHH
jgi:hypothetical protein